MRIISKIFGVLSTFILISCTASEVNKFIQGASEATLSEADVSAGLKEALVQGISEGVESASSTDGFLANDLIRIALPEDVQKVESTLRRFGLGNEVDKVITTINRGAENAAKEAKPIFISAIKQLTIQDAWDILKGGDDAATQYLKRATSDQLTQLFKPHVQESLDQVGATKHYSELVNAYNRVPTTQNKLDPDLNSYVTNMAIEGLFKLVAEEEKAIREDPLERSSVLLKRVFAVQD
ncbi:DUF4197 domain-containing protein [Echinicola marina]|uniref:DUF4197 domain-containing protein n=1 Tax=Echinicola marina TaxID=2859768 RepID=UPI001CF6E262|nr:DUF4197 domain-containing protein [Echinicola marina]UCS94108.1 DUF4197 domain-containing protein [Echinicola marina]